MSSFNTPQPHDHKRTGSEWTTLGTLPPYRPGMRMSTINEFEGAVNRCAELLGTAFKSLQPGASPLRAMDSTAINMTVRHIASAIAALSPIEQVIEPEADQVPVIANWLASTINDLRDLAEQTHALTAQENPELRATLLKALLVQFPLITDRLENTMRTPLLSARRELAEIGSPPKPITE